jgi:hypothetical protein
MATHDLYLQELQVKHSRKQLNTNIYVHEMDKADVSDFRL